MKKISRRSFLAASAAASFTLALTACGGSSSSAPAAGSTPDATAEPSKDTKGGEFHRATGQIADFFSPYKQGSLIEFGWPAMECLAYQINGVGEWHNRLAEEVVVDDDAHTVEITLKKGVKFHNGEEMTGEDLYFSLKAREEYNTLSTIGNPVSIEQTGDYTVKVTYADFSLNYRTWLLPQYVFSKKAFDEHGLDWMTNNLVGTGPYKVKEYIPDDHLTFERFPDYWGGQEPDIDTLTWSVIPDATAQAAAFLAGQVDYLTPTDLATVRQLEAEGFVGEEAAATTGLQTFIIPFSIEPDDPWYKKEVRQAAYLYGIDWDKAAMILGGELGFHTDALGCTGNSYYDPSIEQSQYDLEKAKKMLADAGYPDGFKTVIYTPGNMTNVATILQAELKNMNIDAEVKEVDYTLIQSEYGSAKAATTGLMISALFYIAMQTDRVQKHLNPTGSYGPSTNWTEEIKEAYAKITTARTQEEEDKFMLEYIRQYVVENCFYWPVYNSKVVNYYQPWCRFTENSRVSFGQDPFEVFIDEH